MGRALTHSGLERVIERFPEFASALQERFHADQSLRDICSDYADTIEALQRWEASTAPHRAARIVEYRELAEGLELEIVAALRSPRPRHEA
jgi:hypothetical protein